MFIATRREERISSVGSGMVNVQWIRKMAVGISGRQFHGAPPELVVV
jgi:hypothetical protein